MKSSWLVLLGGSVTAAVRCPNHKEGAYDMYLPYYNKTITVPTIPSEVSLYEYATSNAMVVLPKKCVIEHRDQIPPGKEVDDLPGGPTGMRFLRITELMGGYQTIAAMGESCACGLVIGLGGTSGATWSAVAHSVMLAGLNYLAVILDHQAMPEEYNMRGRTPLKPSSEIVTSNLCGDFGGYEGTCSKFNKPMCYTTKVENIVHNGDLYAEFIERLYLIRQNEINFFVDTQKSLFEAFPKVFLFGNSEGAMVASRYYHPDLHNKLKGIIINSWSCDYNYFVQCPDSALVCEDSCDKKLPLLNFIGDQDEYFSVLPDSVSSRVAAASGGSIGPITGHCQQMFTKQGFENAHVVVFRGAGHGAFYTHGNTIRSVMADFVNDAEQPTSLSGCDLEGGVAICDADMPRTCFSNYTENPDANYRFDGMMTEKCHDDDDGSHDDHNGSCVRLDAEKVRTLHSRGLEPVKCH